MVPYLVGTLLLAYEFAAVAIFLSVNALWGICFAFSELSKKYRNNYKLSKILVQTYRPTKLIDACIFGCLWHPSAYPLGMVKKYLKKKYPT